MAAGVKTLVTAYPFGKAMLPDAGIDLREPFTALDLTEAVARAAERGRVA